MAHQTTETYRSCGGHCWNEVIRRKGKEGATVNRTRDTNWHSFIDTNM